jgi:hypothetical protein
MIPSSFYLDQEQRLYQILNTQSINQPQPIIESIPESQSSSEAVGSTSWDHSDTTHSPTSPTEQGH